MSQVDHFILQYGYAAIFLLLMLGIVGPLIPDETIMVIAGAFIRHGQLHALPAFFAAYAGSVCGITLSYILGRTGLVWVLDKLGPLAHIGKQHMARAHDWFERFGGWTLFFGYFVMGIRHVSALVAGATRLRPAVFAAYAYTGGLVWVICFLSIGYFLGEEWSRISRKLDVAFLIAAAVVAALAAAYVRYRRHRKAA